MSKSTGIRVSKKQIDVVREQRKSNKRSLEPVEIVSGKETVSLLHILKYYNEEHDTKEKKEWALTFFKNSPHIDTLKTVSHQHFGTLGSLCRMSENGVQYDELDIKIEEHLKKVLTSTKDVSEEKPTIAKPAVERIPEIYGEFEGHCDDTFGNRKTLAISSFVGNYSPSLSEISKLKLLIEKKIAEYTEAISDKELLAAYAKTKKECSEIVKMLEDALLELGAKFQRKPKAKKEVPLQKIVAKVKLGSKDPETGISTLEPTVVFGKTMMLCYDFKKRKCIIFKSVDGKTFSFKNSTLINFDEAISEQKTIRNPKDQLVSLVQLPRKALEKAFTLIKTVGTQHSGRFTEDMIICKVF
jgi:hypothetical protein